MPATSPQTAARPVLATGALQTGREFEAPYRLSYQLGCFLATNAIADGYLVVDGPDCIIRKAEYLHGKHDWCTDVLDAGGRHRIATSLIAADEVIMSRGEMVVSRVRQIAAETGAGVIFMTAMPHVAIIGTDYQQIVHDEQPGKHARLVEVPSNALEGDWLDGYEETLNAHAAAIPLPAVTPDPDKVALVGHLMTRLEEDGRADTRELERLVRGLGLDPVSIWYGGGSTADLARVAEAGTIIALPLGRRAAAALASRTGAHVIDAQVPFGLGRTQRLLRALGRATEREAAAEAFIDAELRRLVPRMEFVIPHVFLDRSVAFMGDPNLFGGFLHIAAELGMRVELLAAAAHPAHLREDLAGEFGALPPILMAPRDLEMREHTDRLRALDLDLLIADSPGHDHYKADDCGRVEMGFPCNFSHALFARPTVGFDGWACFVDRMANALLTAKRHAGG